jgi:uncharacterized damage-inducible protein DinB
MTESQRIADQLDRVFEGDSWHGPSLMELLKDVTAAQAASHPVPGGHSIWELVLHLTGWQDAVRRRMNGEVVTVEPGSAQDWPPEGSGDGEWKQALERLKSSHQRIRDEVARLAESRLGETVAGKDYSLYVMLHGLAQHTVYHSGQVGLLKRALASK